MPENVGAAFMEVLPRAVKGFGAKLQGQVGGDLEASGRALGGKFGKAFGLAGGATIAAAGIGKALYEVGQSFEEVRKTIIVGTGASGKALEGLEASAKRIGRATPSSFADIGTAVADLNTRLGLTGKPLENLSSRILNLSRLTKTDLSQNIADVTRLFGDWSIKTKDQPKALDEVFEATKRTGIGLGELTTKTVQFGAPLRQFGFSFEQALALFGKWEKEGVNTTTVLAGLRMGLGRFSKAGKDPQKALAETEKAIKNAGTQAEADKIAIEAFGQRAGPDMAAAVREGRFALGDLVKDIKNSKGAIDDADNRTRTFGESWQIFTNTLKDQVGPAADKVFAGFTNASAKALPAVSAAFGRLGPILKGVFASFSGGGALSSLAATFTQIGTAVQTTLLPALQQFAQSVMPAVVKLGQRLSATLGPAFTTIGNAVSTQLLPAIAKLLPILAPIAKLLLNLFGSALTGAIQGAVSVITGVIQVFAGLVSFVDDLIHGRWSQLWGDFKSILTGALGAIIGALKVWWNLGILSLFKRGFVMLTKGIWVRGWELLKSSGSKALTGLTQAVIRGVTRMVAGFARLPGRALGALRGLGPAVRGLLTGALRLWLGVVKTEIGLVVKVFRELPGKVIGALGNLGGKLVGVGQDIVRGLIRGIGSLAGDVTRALLALIPGPLKKFAGKLGIGSPSKVFARLGEFLPMGLARGIAAGSKHAIKALEKLADQLKSRMQDLASTVSSIASSVADAFKPDLFSGGLGALIGGLASGVSNLQAALAALPKLTAAGASGDFLQQLFASGNTALITALAGGPASQVAAAQSQFTLMQSLAGQLGAQVAGTSPEQVEIAKVHAELVAIRKELKKHPEATGEATKKALNSTATTAKRRKRRA